MVTIGIRLVRVTIVVVMVVVKMGNRGDYSNNVCSDIRSSSIGSSNSDSNNSDIGDNSDSRCGNGDSDIECTIIIN